MSKKVSKPNPVWFENFFDYIFKIVFFSKPNWIWVGNGHCLKCSCRVGGGVQRLFGQCSNELLYFYDGASLRLMTVK